MSFLIQEEVNANYPTLCPMQYWVQVIIQKQCLPRTGIDGQTQLIFHLNTDHS